MHELGIVYHIIRDVEDVARANGVARVSGVTLQLGEVSGVVPELLSDAWRWAADRTDVCTGAELAIETLPARTRCSACGEVYATVEHGRVCPACQSEDTVLMCGQEIAIKEIAVPDDTPDADGAGEDGSSGSSARATDESQPAPERQVDSSSTGDPGECTAACAGRDAVAEAHPLSIDD